MRNYSNFTINNMLLTRTYRGPASATFQPKRPTASYRGTKIESRKIGPVFASRKRNHMKRGIFFNVPSFRNASSKYLGSEKNRTKLIRSQEMMFSRGVWDCRANKYNGFSFVLANITKRGVRSLVFVSVQETLRSLHYYKFSQCAWLCRRKLCLREFYEQGLCAKKCTK